MNPIRKMINEVLDQQDKKGMETYGQTLADCDDKAYDWQNMALQELADGMQYLAKENLRLRKELKVMKNEEESEEIKFLKDLQQSLKYQSEHDYDSQASPRFWVIRDYRIVPANDEYDEGFDQYIHNDGDHTVFKDFSDLKAFLEEYFTDEIETDEALQELLKDGNDDMYELWEYVEENLNDDNFFTKVFVKEESFIVPDTMFLLKEEAKKHLEKNYYHYSSKAHTYAMTAWRAPKVKKLLNILETFNWA